MNPAFWTDTNAALAYRAQPAQPTAESPPKIGNAPEGQSEARGNEPNDLQSSTPNAPVQSFCPGTKVAIDAPMRKTREIYCR